MAATRNFTIEHKFFKPLQNITDLEEQQIAPGSFMRLLLH